MLNKRIHLTLFALAGLLGVFAQSPITLGNSNMPSSGDTLRFTNIQLNSLSNYTNTGASYVWDFRAVVSGTSGLRSYKSALQTPYAFYFLNPANYGEKVDNFSANTGSFAISNYYNFYKKSSSPNCFQAEGVGLSLNSIPVAAFYTDKDELYNFPMSYPQYDSTTFKFTTLTTSLLPISYTRAGYRVTKVDGWGSVTTPFGTDNCLRVMTTQYSMDTMAVTLSTLIPVPIKFGFPNNQRSYQWLTLTSKIPYMEVNGSLIGNNFTVTQARYRGVNNTNPVGLAQQVAGAEPHVFPNPAASTLNLADFPANANTLQLFDVQGKCLKSFNLQALAAKPQIDLSDLPAGLYVLTAGEGPDTVRLQFIKQ